MKAVPRGMSRASRPHQQTPSCNPMPSNAIPFISPRASPGDTGRKIQSSMQPHEHVVRLMLEPFTTFSGMH
jgi:hypothetical protein